MDGDTLAQLKEHLLSLSFGPVHPIPKSFAFTAVNIYSKKDYLAKRYATPFLHDPEYDIRIVKCKSPRRKRNFFFADHQFMGITYQEQLERKIDDTRQQMGIYDDPHR